MSTKHAMFTGALLGSTVTLAALLLLGINPPRAAHAGGKQQWEYTFCSVKGSNVELNKLGKVGWEGYAMISDTHVALKRLR